MEHRQVAFGAKLGTLSHKTPWQSAVPMAYLLKRRLKPDPGILDVREIGPTFAHSLEKAIAPPIKAAAVSPEQFADQGDPVLSSVLNWRKDKIDVSDPDL